MTRPWTRAQPSISARNSSRSSASPSITRCDSCSGMDMLTRSKMRTAYKATAVRRADDAEGAPNRISKKHDGHSVIICSKRCRCRSHPCWYHQPAGKPAVLFAFLRCSSASCSPLLRLAKQMYATIFWRRIGCFRFPRPDPSIRRVSPRSSETYQEISLTFIMVC
jgi:hypothetical protein